MLKINNLNIVTNTGRTLVSDFSFVLNEGDKIALIGEEGNGKSTILKIIAGIDVSDYLSYSGNIETDGRIGYMSQSISKEDLSKDVISYIDDEPDYNRIYSLLKRISVNPDLIGERLMSTLSGGEKVKISLLKILYEDPDILLLDEPSNDLDLETLIWLEEFIRNTQLPMIFVSHDETLLENCANGILHLEQLKRKKEAHISFSRTGYREYMESRNAYISRNNMIAAKEKQELHKQMEKWRKIYQKVEHSQNSISRSDPHGGMMLKKKMHAVKSQQKILETRKENLRSTYEPEEAIDIFFNDVEMNPNKVILDLELPTLRNEDKVLAENIHMKILGKDKVCIIGENGAGKTSLMRIIYEQLKDRTDIRVGYMPQNYYEMMDEELTPVGFLWDGNDFQEKSRIQTHLGSLKFTPEEMGHKIKDLSEGQKCKILLLKLILDNNDVLLLDEPTRNLSPLSGPRIREILSDYNGCIIMVSHDRKLIEEVGNRIYTFSDGHLTLLDGRDI